MKKILFCFYFLFCSISIIISQNEEEKITSDLSKKAFEKGKYRLSIGYGFPNALKRILAQDFNRQLVQWQNFGVQNTSSIDYSVTGFGPISFRVEQAATNWLGIGPVFMYSRAALRYQFQKNTSGQNGYYIQTNNYEMNTYQIQTFSAGLRLNFHLHKNESEDLYFGLTGGYNMSLIDYSSDYNNPFLHAPNSFSRWDQVPYILGDLRSPAYFAFVFGFREYVSKSLGVFAEIGYDRWSFIHGGLVFR